MTISGINAANSLTTPSSELPDLLDSMVQGLRNQEGRIRTGIFEGLKPNGDVLGLPDHVREQFKVWDATFTNAADRNMVNQLKQKIMAITQSRETYVTEQVQSKTARIQLELAMRAASKTTSGIQQILSAQ